MVSIRSTTRPALPLRSALILCGLVSHAAPQTAAPPVQCSNVIFTFLGACREEAAVCNAATGIFTQTTNITTTTTSTPPIQTFTRSVWSHVTATGEAYSLWFGVGWEGGDGEWHIGPQGLAQSSPKSGVIVIQSTAAEPSQIPPSAVWLATDPAAGYVQMAEQPRPLCLPDEPGSYTSWPGLPGNNTTTPSSGSGAGAAVGIVCAVLILGGVAYYYRRRLRGYSSSFRGDASRMWSQGGGGGGGNAGGSSGNAPFQASSVYSNL